MTRKTHLVGTWPGRSAPHAMETAFARLGPHLLRMTDGETGERSRWVLPVMERMRVNSDVEKSGRKHEEYSTIGDWQVKEGHELQPENIYLGKYAAFRENYPAFKHLRAQFDEPETSFQVGFVAPLDYVSIIFGSVADEHPEYEEAFRQATIREIEQIHAEAGDDVIFQIETVKGLVAITSAPDDDAKRAMASDIAERLNKLIAGSPKGARWGAHLCLGDFKHKSMGKMTDATPVVLLANALAAGFPADHKLEYIHGPFAAAAEPPSGDESWYRPLEELDIPTDVRFVAGFIHEDVPTEENQKLLSVVEGFTGREVDVATACGLGRRPDPAQAWDAMDKAVALLESDAQA